MLKTLTIMTIMTAETGKEFEPISRDCWFLTGPTASGKSNIAIALARQLDAEIISLDSMAIYRGMDIGTAKPTAEQQQQVVHHMIDVVEPTESYSLAEYLTAVHALVGQIHERQRCALFVGGTPLYLKSLLRGLYSGPEADWEFREQVQRELEEHGPDALHARLAQVDPLSAHKLHPNDSKRIIRALEVFRATGEPISHQQVHFDDTESQPHSRAFVLSWERPELHQRIEQRVDEMFSRGLVTEVDSLLATHGELSRTAMQAVGYREVIDHVSGNLSFEDTVEKVKARTRQFARRQVTWFRRLDECQIINRSDSDSVKELISQIAATGSE